VPTDIRRERLSNPAATGLITALNTELRGRYPNPVDCHFDLTAEEVTPGRGAFVVASEGGVDVGCGAVRLIGEGLAELKRLYVTPACRQRGIASTVLAFLESEARALCATRIVLETGVHSPDGLALYRRAGYKEIEKFGPYVDSLVSICMGKDLAAD
jgi:ribosomal protein S18 acetylase RimI-like enzyme